MTNQLQQIKAHSSWKIYKNAELWNFHTRANAVSLKNATAQLLVCICKTKSSQVHVHTASKSANVVDNQESTAVLCSIAWCINFH